MFEAIKKEFAAAQEKAEAKVKSDQAKARGDSSLYKPHIRVTTFPPQGSHEVVSIIFAIDAHKEGIFSSANPTAAFVGAVNKLKDQCEELGGTAVVSAQFEYRVAVGTGWGSSKQVMEIFAYGTVIKDLG